MSFRLHIGRHRRRASEGLSLYGGAPMKHKITREDFSGLWSLLWRVVLFGTVLLPLGAALLVLLLAWVCGPPVYAVACFVDGRPFLGLGVVLGWLISLRLARGRGLLRRFSEGIEYAGI